MTYKLAVIGLLAAALTTAPLASASAEPWRHGGWHGGGGWGHHDHDHFGLIGGIVGAGVAVTGAAVALAAAPFEAVASVAAPPPVYAQPAPVYAQPAYYPAPPYYPVYGYYQPRRVVVYGYPGYPPY